MQTYVFTTHFIREVFSNLSNVSQIIQYNEFCLNKYLCIENKLQEEEMMRKFLIWYSAVMNFNR